MNIKVYNITPIPKPRMTRSDKWKKRPSVLRYWEYKDQIKLAEVELPEYHHIIFVVPMAKSWSAKKKDGMDGTPHKQTPDIDNYVKACYDALYSEDSHIWTTTASKLWGYQGKIIIVDVTHQSKAFFDELDRQLIFKGL